MDQEEENKYQKLRKLVLRAIIDDDMDVFCEACPIGVKTSALTNRLRTLLLRKQNFPRLGPDYDPHMSRILMNVLVAPCSLRPVAQNPNRGVTDDDLLDACLKRYRGYMLHIAAALGRTRVAVKMLDVVLGLDWVGGVRRLTAAKDSEDHTALVVAVLAQSREMVRELVDCIKSDTYVKDKKTVTTVFRNAVQQSTFHLHQKPVQDMAQLLYRLVKHDGCIRLTDISIYLPICCEDLISMRTNIVAQRTKLSQNKTQPTARSPLSVQNGPSGLHFAVWRYSDRQLGDKRRGVLNYLMNCEGRRMAELQEECQMYADHDLLISGTPVHFAAYRLSIPFTDIGKVTPPLREPEPCWPRQEDPPQERSKARASNSDNSEQMAAGPEDHSEPVSKEPEADAVQADPSTEGGSTESNKPGEDGSKRQVHEKKKDASKSGKDAPAASPVQFIDCPDANVDGILGILDMLQKNGADFHMVNREGKTPLDLLPSDTDPQVVKKLLGIMRPESENKKK